ncbi:hypothetical protein Tco_0665365 [Tanacetum coccineum]
MPHFHDDPLHESLHKDSTSQGSSSNVRPIHTPFESLGRWTKDHPIANVIRDPSRSISTRKQLPTDAMWCYFDAFLTSVEPKNFKQEMTEPSWIDAMKEEIHKFERLQVWELVPYPDKMMPCCVIINAFLTSVDSKNFKQVTTEPSWIDAMKEEIHEFGMILQSVGIGPYPGKEEGINFEDSFKRFLLE